MYCDVTTRNLSHTCSWECQNAMMVAKRRANGTYVRTDDAREKTSKTLLNGFATGRLVNLPHARGKHWRWTVPSTNHWAKTNEGKKCLSDLNKGRTFTDEARQNMSHAQTKRLRNKRESLYTSARGGTREDLGMYFRSGWEANFARVLNFEGKTWTYEHQTFELNDPHVHSYTPDFYVHDEDTYYELKGRMNDKDRIQLRLMDELYPEVKLILIEGAQYGELGVRYKNKVSWEGK